MNTTTLLFLTLVNQYNVPPTDAGMLTCIAMHESSLNSQAINHGNRNGTKDFGLFQINSLWLKELKLKPKDLLNVDTNIKAALHIYKVQGVKAWVAHRRCK
jgi:hypothetical protein